MGEIAVPGVGAVIQRQHRPLPFSGQVVIARLEVVIRGSVTPTTVFVIVSNDATRVVTQNQRCAKFALAHFPTIGEGSRQFWIIGIISQLVVSGFSLQSNQHFVKGKRGDGLQINSAANGVGIKIWRECLVHRHTVQQIGGHPVEDNAASVFRRGRTYAIDRHGVKVRIHAPHGDITSFTLIVFHHDAGDTAQGFSDIYVSEIANGIGVNHTGDLVCIPLLLDRALQAGPAADNDYLINGFLTVRLCAERQPNGHSQ